MIITSLKRMHLAIHLEVRYNRNEIINKEGKTWTSKKYTTKFL